MEVKIIENKPNKLKFEVRGADHVLMNLLTSELSKDKGVEFNTYSEPHPLLEGFVVIVKGKNPSDSVKKAMGAIVDNLKQLQAGFDKAK